MDRKQLSLFRDGTYPDITSITIIIGGIFLFIFAVFSVNTASTIFSVILLVGFIAHLIAKKRKKEPFVRKYLLTALVVTFIALFWIFINYLIYLICRFLGKS